MKFTLESKSAASVRRVSATEIMVGNQVWTRPVALTESGVMPDWRPVPVEQLSIDDLAPLIAAGPELIIVGTGEKQVLPNRELMFAMARRGIGLEMMDTAAAARTFNVLLGEGRSVAAALYLSTTT
ncbi:MAG: MTH938/NDUFAF3 family protein [Gammaproteobacteria bacterium]|nr:MTH938/NDUFAF3 family protein [Gammaproteobacteria bacterium]MDH5303280.1 MTH938/NDUFAF3 family protein [Gammaproteobacteria bacterium]MDH5322018.1 MTH938/NDUFAF3 family protein [Gammaproteobacteria bacterium]